MSSDKETDYFGKALTEAKEAIKILEDSLHKQSDALERTRREDERLRKEIGQEFNSLYEDIGLTLLEQPHLHADETGWRVGGDNGWLWSLSNKEYSYYKIEGGRGQDVVECILGKSYGGVLVSDFYGAYNKIDCAKQKCWAHLMRELRDLAEKYPKDEEIKYYLSRMERFFNRGKKLQVEYGDGVNRDGGSIRLNNDFRSFIFHPPNNENLKRLSKRLIKYRNEMFT